MNEKLLAFVPSSHLPRHTYFGRHSMMFLKALKGESLALLSSKSAYESHKETLGKYLDLESIPLQLHQGEPTDNSVEELKSFVAKHNPKYLLAFGGGSVIDLAKLSECELVAIPTTPGTGSEVNQFSLLTIDSKKTVIASPKNVPDHVLYFGDFLTTLSPQQIKEFLFDALSHAIEGFYSKMGNSFTSFLAPFCIRTLLDQLNQEKYENYEDILMSGMIAGIIQASASVGLVHGIAHIIGSSYHIPHAKMIRATLPFVLQSHLNNIPEEILAQKEQQLEPVGLSLQKIIDTLETFSIEKPDLSNVELSEELKANIQSDICTKTNPYKPTIEQIEHIVSEICK